MFSNVQNFVNVDEEERRRVDGGAIVDPGVVVSTYLGAAGVIAGAEEVTRPRPSGGSRTYLTPY